jgi:hypothetical protein
MNCRDFERLWNELLDARGAGPPDVERALEAHAASCPACRALGTRYQVLGHAIRALGLAPVPAVSPGFTDRVLAAAAAAEADRPAVTAFRPARWLSGLAAAAALTVAVGLGLRAWPPRAGAPPRVLDPPRSAPAPLARVRAIDPDDLTAALADATSATLALAREASAPAARVGGQVFGVSELREPLGGLGLSPAVIPAAEMLQEVGDRVNAGVAPLEGTARSAFGFLLGSPTQARAKDADADAGPDAPRRGA